MQISLDSKPFSEVAAEALVTCVFDKDQRIEGVIADLDRATGGKIRVLVESGELTGKMFEMVLLHFPAGIAAQRLLLVGGGKQEKFTAADLRKIAGAALRYLKTRGIKKFAFLSREGERDPKALQAVTEGLFYADYESDKYRTEKKNKNVVESVLLAGWDPAGNAEYSPGHPGARQKHRRVAKFLARSGERAFELSDAADARRSRIGDGARGGTDG